MGEDANTKKDYGNAEVMFATAGDYYCKTIHLMQHPENASKILNRNERSAVFYSKGYNEVMIYETQKKHDFKQLRTAYNDFRKVEKETSNYFKAQRAITKTTEILAPPQGALNKWGPRIILAFVAVVFLIAQLLFIFGKPMIGVSGYIVDKNKIETLNPVKKPLNQTVVSKLKEIAEQKLIFSSNDDFLNNIRMEFGDSLAVILKPTELLKGKMTIKEFQSFDTGYYVLITFACLLFMIAGLYLDQISKLKVGAIELEKSTIDQISTSTSLGISR